METFSLIGEFHFDKKPLVGVDEVFHTFYTKDFQKLNDRKRSDHLNRALLDLIHKQEEPAFILAGVLDFVERVDREDILHHYRFNSFELWLNQYSGLSFEENLGVRAKIVGKKIPRDDYQALFPIGRGKVYEGTHFVTAHKSPDLDTTVASFWGWMDSFAARVGDGMHVWNVPGGPPASQIEIDLIFRDIFGSAVFSHLAKERMTLSLSGNDLMTQQGMLRKLTNDLSYQVDHERHEKQAIVVVDDQGYYIGDWRTLDIELIRQIIYLLSGLLRWFENSIQVNLISLFAKKSLSLSMIPDFIENIFKLKLKDCEPARDYTDKQKGYLNDFLQKICGLKEGLNASFEDFWNGQEVSQDLSFPGLGDILSSIKKENLFDGGGLLIENRPVIFTYLENTISKLHKAMLSVKKEMDRLGLGLQVKQEILGLSPNYVTVRSDVEEMRSKMGAYQHLTVVYPDAERFSPVGIVRALDLRKKTLGTVSLRDFSNRNEMQIPSYIDVISIIDHHRIELDTSVPPFIIIGDAQSCNTLVAEQAFVINDTHSLSNMTLEQITAQIKEVSGKTDPSSSRIFERLLQLQRVAVSKQTSYIHPEREFVEYLHFLYGIIDDTDLLTKVSARDIKVIAALINRMKSLTLKKQVEILNFDELALDEEYAKNAAEKILKNEDMYSVYKKVYAFREQEVEKNISLASENKPHNLFADTKEQNGCCRIGQTKVFANNMKSLHKHSTDLRKAWVATAEQIQKDRKEFDLHMQMISTIVSSEEVFVGKKQEYNHKDELWIWIPETDLAQEHLKRFLNAFRDCKELQGESLEVEFLGDNEKLLRQLFSESFRKVEYRAKNENIPIAVIYYKAGIINSRKAAISPYLPNLVS